MNDRWVFFFCFISPSVINPIVCFTCWSRMVMDGHGSFMISHQYDDSYYISYMLVTELCSSFRESGPNPPNVFPYISYLYLFSTD